MTDGEKRKGVDALDEALRETFPGSDPIALGHSDHVGSPKGHTHSVTSERIEVVDNEAQSRFELNLGQAVAFAYYKRDGNTVTLLHTEVPQELSGRGIGSRLADGVFRSLLGRGDRVIAKCPFMAAYVARRPEYAEILAG
jgi:uncharacterized protein